MILSGKQLKKALKSGVEGLCPKKLPHPVLIGHMDKAHSLFRDKKDETPLFSCSLKGDFRLPLLELAVGTAVGITAFALLSSCMERKLPFCGKRGK